MLPPVASSCREYVSQMWANLRAAEIAREVRRCAALVPSAWDVPEIVRQRVELKPDRVGVERATRKGCPFDLFLAFMYPALGSHAGYRSRRRSSMRTASW